MDATSQPDASVGGNEASTSDASLNAIAENAFDVIHCWCTLLKMEVALARRSLRALPIGALVLPVLALSAWLSLIALISVAIYSLTGNWPLALLLGAILQLSLLTQLLRFWLRWSLNFTLPQSRAALRRAMERMS